MPPPESATRGLSTPEFSTGGAAPGGEPWADRYDPVVDLLDSNAVVGQLVLVPTRPMLRLGSDSQRRLTLTPGGVWIYRNGLEQRLDLAGFWIDNAVPLGPVWGRRKARNSPWELVISSPSTSLTVRGPWVLIGYLGTLAGWPEPH